MKILHSMVKNYVVKDDDSLYAIIRRPGDISITIFDLETLYEVGSFTTKCQVSHKCHSTIDENHIYFVDMDSNLLYIDKISGEVLQKIHLGALCIANLEQDEDFIYALCLLPTRSDNIKFVTYFIQKINKTTGESFKFAYKEGSPTQNIVLQENIIISDSLSITCFLKNGKEKWVVPLKSKMINPLVGNEKYVAASSPEGRLQLFETPTGNGKFSLQLPKSRVLPLIFEETVYWLSENTLHSIDIHKISNRTLPWEDKTILPIEHPIIMGMHKGECVVGNIYGQILKNNAVLMLDKKEEWSAVVSLDTLMNRLICETPQKVYVLGEE